MKNKAKKKINVKEKYQKSREEVERERGKINEIDRER